jgi:hypothetical protein
MYIELKIDGQKNQLFKIQQHAGLRGHGIDNSVTVRSLAEIQNVYSLYVPLS